MYPRYKGHGRGATRGKGGAQLNRWRLLGIVAVFVAISPAMLAAPTTVLGADLTLNPQLADPPVAAVWAKADGPTGQMQSDDSWIWGPAIRSITREPYHNSPGGSREVYYFDKARLAINDETADPSSPWYVSPGLLVREMISGWIQVGDAAYVQTEPAAVPVTGDVTANPTSPTYASLRAVASIGSDDDARRRPNQIGQPVMALLQADGTVVDGAVPDSTVRNAAYDEVLGHNIADVFVEWISEQPYAWEYLVGLPITEPYWVDSAVGGRLKRVLVQAFERRVLTYTPDNVPEWQVEAGNVGLHYRVWRWLRMPEDRSLIPLAAGVPLGEVIVGKALAYGIDPYLFAALAQQASGFNPLAQHENGGTGLFAVRPEYIPPTAAGHPLDPVVNADHAAAHLADLRAFTDDWRAVLAIYYTGSANPDWSDPALNAFVSGVLDTKAQLIAQFANASPDLFEGRTAEPSTWVVGTGPAAYYSPSYTVAWWENTLQRHASWGNAVPGWAPDPNGYYCVHPDFRPGQRLRLSANGVTLWCTIGDAVAPWDEAAWRARWAVELSYPTFTALGLHHSNVVTVEAP